MPWPLRIDPLEDELLSSFLVRAALRHGLSPYRFCAYHFKRVAIWNRDVDRSATDNLLHRISVEAELPVERVVAMTLRDIETATSDRQPNVRRQAPWINAAGVYHQIRRRWGLQYCPHCLERKPVFRRMWRLSFMTVCDVHSRPLLDACPNCDAPVVPHRQLISPRLCHACSSDLARVRCTMSQSILPLDSLLTIQRRYTDVIVSGQGRIGDSLEWAPTFFQGLRVLTQVFDEWRSVLDQCSRDDTERVDAWCSLERARVYRRAMAVQLQDRLSRNWPTSFIERASDCGLTQRSFVRMRVPTWLRLAIEMLPLGHVRNGKRKKSILRRRLRALHRSRNPEWRDKRAALLLQAASRLR